MITLTEKENLEEKIIRAAKEVFIEKGFAGASMSAIAERAGMNRPSLHYYFRTKDKMFQAVFGDILQSIVPRIFDIAIRREQPVRRRVEEIVDTYYELFTANPRLPMFIVREMNRDASLLIETAMQLRLTTTMMPAWQSLQQEMDEGRINRMPLRFLFFNLYGLMAMPFLTIDLTSKLFLEEGETFAQMLDKWKPYIIAQLDNLLVPRTDSPMKEHDALF